MTSRTSSTSARNELKKALARKELLVIAGTGVTAAATRNDPRASWGGLIESAIENCVYLGKRDDAWADRAKEDARSAHEVDLIAAAEKATGGMGGTEGPDFRTWLMTSVGGLTFPETDLTGAIQELESAGALVATTNYDDCLEDACSLPPVTWRDPDRVQRVLRNDEHAVIHIHGHYADPKSVVFGSSSYADVLRDEQASLYLKMMFYGKTVVFVGFGGGLRDPNFTALRRWMRTTLRGSAYSHYRLARTSEIDIVDAEHSIEERILVVDYGVDHTDLPPFLRSISSGTSGSGARGLGPTTTPGPEVTIDSPADMAVPLVVVPVNREALTVIREAVKRFEEIKELAESPDTAEAAKQLGGGAYVDASRRFLDIFKEEIEAVEMANRDLDHASAEYVKDAADWASELLRIWAHGGGQNQD